MKSSRLAVCLSALYTVGCGGTVDSQVRDSGRDVGVTDLGAVDTGAPAVDVGPADTGVVTSDVGVADSGAADVGTDAGTAVVDTGPMDTGVVAMDAGPADTGPADTGVLPFDAGQPDVGPPDVGPPDTGPSCVAPQALCGGQCVNPQTDPAHCGTCGTACTAPTNGTAGCVAGQCQPTCNTGFTLVGAACVPCGAVGQPACTTGSPCAAGLAACTGACRATQTDSTHCGTCGTTCTAPTNGTTACVAGQCQPTCNTGFTLMGAACVPCGAVGQPACTTGTACTTELTACAGTCRATQTDPAHCGACGSTCTGGTCATGQCTCPSGLTLCGGRCVDLATDTDNCGACGYRATGGRRCEAGQPQPSWLPMASEGLPLGTIFTATWTGRELLTYVQRGNDPPELAAWNADTNQWTTVPQIPGRPLPWESYLVGMPDRNGAFVLGRRGAFLLERTGDTLRWTEVERTFPLTLTNDLYTYTSCPSTGTSNGIYGGRYLFFPQNVPNTTGLVYDLQSRLWRQMRGWNTCSIGCGSGAGGISYALMGTDQLVAVGSSEPSNQWRCRNWGDSIVTGRYSFETDTWAQRATWPYEGYRFSAGHTGGNAAMLPLGDAVLMGNAWSFQSVNLTNPSGRGQVHGSWLLEYGQSSQGQVPVMISGGGGHFIAYTGRVVLGWGGINGSQDPNAVRMLNQGRFAVRENNTIRWADLPVAPTSFLGRQQIYGQHTQGLWTGREFLVLGGYTGWSVIAPGGPTIARDGVRYQPPVGCVCPRLPSTPAAVAEGCAGVSTPPSLYAQCAPR